MAIGVEPLIDWAETWLVVPATTKTMVIIKPKRINEVLLDRDGVDFLFMTGLILRAVRSGFGFGCKA
jgi:hypothetical protein